MLELYDPRPDAVGQVTYKLLAEHIRTLVHCGKLAPGTKLPSSRALSIHLGVSRLTVLRSYSWLAEKGYTESGTRNGTWIAEDLPYTASLDSLKSNSDWSSVGEFVYIIEKGQVRSLSLSLPDLALFDADEFIAALGDLRGCDPVLWGFPPDQGLATLNVQLSRVLLQHGISCTGDQLLSVSGTANALALFIQAFARGKTVLLEDPSCFDPQGVIEHHGARVVRFKRTYLGIDLDELKALFHNESPVAIILTPAFNNPTGGVLSKSQSEELLELCAKHSVIVLELDLYRNLALGQSPAPPLAAIAPEQVVYLTCLSYTLAPAIRIATIRSKRSLRNAMLACARYSGFAPPSYLQHAVAQYIASNGLARHLARVIPRYRARRDAMMSSLAQYLPNCEATYPLGGFSTWVKLPPGDWSGLSHHVVELGTAITPGRLVSSWPDADQHIRLTFGQHSPEEVRESVKVLSGAINAR